METLFMNPAHLPNPLRTYKDKPLLFVVVHTTTPNMSDFSQNFAGNHFPPKESNSN